MDFVGLEVGWGPAAVTWKDGEPNFEIIAYLVGRNAELGYRTSLIYPGERAVDFCIWNPADRALRKRFLRGLAERLGPRAWGMMQ